ncbi:hypothetical protein HAX54_053327, partial [Datura stramonium]|nr:hypothetical protein [Datura stramonium]
MGGTSSGGNNRDKLVICVVTSPTYTKSARLRKLVAMMTPTTKQLKHVRHPRIETNT